jgi:hypothetical protein
MNTKILVGPRWSTSSFGAEPLPTATELSALGEHLDVCRRLSGRLFALECRAQALHGFVAARFVTTLVAVVLLLAGASALASAWVSAAGS